MTLKTKRAALYLRVSTGEQTTENQRLELSRVAQGRGWTVEAIYEDAGISGAKGRAERPGLDRMLKEATAARFDVVMSWAIDRLGRSLMQLLETMNELHALGVGLYLHQQAIDSTTPAGKAMLQMCGVFAEFEREMIRERVNAGIKRAMCVGTKSGKPIGRPRVDEAIQNAVRAAKNSGASLRAIAAQYGISVGVVHRIASTPPTTLK